MPDFIGDFLDWLGHKVQRLVSWFSAESVRDVLRWLTGACRIVALWPRWPGPVRNALIKCTGATDTIGVRG